MEKKAVQKNACALLSRIAFSAVLFTLYIAAPLAAEDMSSVDTDSSRTGFRATLTEPERDWLQNHPVIRVVMDPGWPPVEFADERGSPSGISADYLDLIEKRLGIRFERVLGLAWQEAYARLKSWDIDMTTSVARTPEREEFWAFTKPYLRIPIVIATQMDATYIASMNELKGKSVAIVRGYAIGEWMPRDYPGIALVPVRTVEEGLDMLRRGKVYAYIDNLLIVGNYQTKLKIANIKIAGQTPYENAQCMAVRKDWEPLAQILQKALDSIPETELNEIYRKWVPIRYEHGFDYTLFWRALAAFAVVVSFLILWIGKLGVEIRHRKKAETALWEEHWRLESIIEGTRVGTWEWDVPAGNITVNARWVQMLGYSIAELVPITFEIFKSLLHPDDFKSLMVLIERLFSGALPFFESEFRMRHKNGEWIWVSSRGSLVTRDDKGQPLLVFGFHTDITERKLAEGELRRSLGEKAVLLQEVHHRVKNNLNIILSLINLQTAEIRSPDQALSAFQNIRDRIMAMALVHDELYRSNDFTIVDMSQYLEKLTNQLSEAYIIGKNIRLNAQTEGVSLSMNVSIPCGLILNELITNSLKHAFPEGRSGEITVLLRKCDEKTVELSVSDDGVGFPVERRTREHDSLGLTLVNLLVNQLKGNMELSGESGTRCVIRFPENIDA